MKKLLVLLVMLLMVITLTACNTNLDALELLERSNEAQADISSWITEADSQISASMTGMSMDIAMFMRKEVESEDRMRMDMIMTMFDEDLITSTFFRDGYTYSETNQMGEAQRAKEEAHDLDALVMPGLATNITENMIEYSSATATDDGYRIEFTLNDNGIMEFLEDLEGLNEIFHFESVYVEDDDDEESNNIIVIYLDEDYTPISSEAILAFEVTIEGMTLVMDINLTSTIVQLGDVTIDFPDWLDEISEADAGNQTVLEGAESSKLLYLDNADMEAIINDVSGDGTFVYVGRRTCPFCVELEPILQETLIYLGQELQYFDTDLADLEDSNRRAEILAHLGITGVPVIVFIENGVAEDALIGVHGQEEIIDFFNSHGGLR